MQSTLSKKLKSNTDKISNFLGWFSIGLGVVQIVAPRGLCRLIGLKTHPLLMRLFGAREIVSGVGLLSQPQHQDRWLKARVAGDAMDIAGLASAMASNGSTKAKVAMATAAVAGVTAVDVLCAAQMKGRPFQNGQPLSLRKSITINRAPNELYQFWRNFSQLAQFMSHLESVTDLGNNRSHWVAKGPAGMKVEWDAQITDERPNEFIAWRSLEGAEVVNSGQVRFEPAPANRGTVVKVQLQYEPPAGRMGAMVAKLLGEAPEKQIAVDLLRFKQLLETGEIARTEGQPAGRPRSTSRKFDDLVRA